MANVRMTQNMLAERSTLSLQGSLQRLARTQETLSTGKRINRPSDSPADSSTAMRLRVSVADQDRYLRSAQDGLGRLATMDSTMASMADNLRRANELALQGANGATSATAREALAVEVDQLREGLLSQANTTYLGRPVFGGVTPGTRAFDDAGTYVGSTAGQVTRTVADGVKLRVDLPGTDVVGPDGANLFDDLTALSAALRADDVAGVRVGITAMQSRLTNLGEQQARVGSVQRRADVAIQEATDRGFALRASLSEVEDADFPRTMIDLKVNEVAYQAALGATARVMQPSLLDFLR